MRGRGTTRGMYSMRALGWLACWLGWAGWACLAGWACWAGVAGWAGASLLLILRAVWGLGGLAGGGLAAGGLPGGSAPGVVLLLASYF